ncbi:MAG: hypothetical protein AAF196_12790 [Planctomycetota bacterium]
MLHKLMPFVLVLVAPLSVAQASESRGDFQRPVHQHDSEVAASVAAHTGAVSPRTGHSDGYWRTVRERVWVPGTRRVVHVPARYDWRYDSCGRRVRVCVQPAGTRVIQNPGCYQYQTRRVWVPARRPVVGPRSGRRTHRVTNGRRGLDRSPRRGRGRIN